MPETTSNASTRRSTPHDGTRKLRSACDACHSAKIRCSGGGVPCTRCERDGVRCHYSYRANLGKPKGSLNKKTLERLKRNAEQQQSANSDSNSNSDAQTSHDRTQQFAHSAGSLDCNRTLSVCDPMTTLSSMAPQQQATPLSPSSLDDIMGLGSCSNSLDAPGSSTFPDLPMFDDHMPDFSDSINVDVLHQFSPRILETRAPQSHATAQSAGGESEDSESDDEESEDEAKKLEAFNLFTSACARTSQNGPSLFPSRHGSRHDSRHDSFHIPCASDYNPMPSPAATDSQGRTRMSSLSCNCFQTLTDQLCQLRAVGQNQYPVNSGIDTMLSNTQLTLSSISSFLQCISCSVDTQAFFLASMVLSSTLRLNDTLVHPPGAPCPRLQIRIGNYNASGQLGEVVKMVLVSSELGKLKSLLESFGRKVDALQGEPTTVDFLRFQTRSLERELKRTTRRVGVPDLRGATSRCG
ncbi:hypothetical protein K432DRAFT_438786 [Lepidopterella palustris CBS 459.81]|uniref:Zn(2)-C6 fungal-type domain-containing protein n=1 Tax=Lepidopterella palustris CBS 459.81 TaxID=1314670 RepID=A0A8E2JL81_9PEZI|nr:hypothetical protein K432DRAFT_438786 [Lepidopterella palustris CBS 459.81]